MHHPGYWYRLPFLLACAGLLFILVLLPGTLLAANYYVDGGAPDASDQNAGTEAAPWKTISRAASAEELQPGDTVLVKSGVYREEVIIEKSGEPDKPLTFAVAPGHRVVIKGSDVIRGSWTRLADEEGVEEPYPNAYSRVWKIKLGDEYFKGAYFRNTERRYVSSIFINDTHSLQQIGPDPIYKNDKGTRITVIGRDLRDITSNSFYFDKSSQTLYVSLSGRPSWYLMEVGVRQWLLKLSGAHDVVIRGFEMRHNRQPGGQWPAVSVAHCQRVLVEDCRITHADFCGLGLGSSKDCVVRRCDLSYNGNTGLNLHKCEDCRVEGCTVMFNNTRRFHQGWHAGGMKNIPSNRRCTIVGCEVAYNIQSPGIWFDSDNADCRIIGNIVHHNGGCGIFYEISKGGGIIADNLVYANRNRGIYISGSQNVWVVHNTVAANHSGIVCMPRGKDWPLENVSVLNNLLLRNYISGPGHPRGCDLTLHMGPWVGGPPKRTVMSNHSDCNVYSTTGCTPTMRHHWNPDNTLQQWQERFGEDLHSKLMPAGFELHGMGFKLLTPEGLKVAGPLPTALDWNPQAPNRVGCSRTQWP